MIRDELEASMGKSSPYRVGRVGDEQVEVLRRRLVELSPRLDDHQIIVLTDTLHDILRSRRGGRSFRQVDLRV